MKKPSKEQIRDLLLIILTVCLFKIAFWGTTVSIKTSRSGIPVNISSDVTIDTVLPIRVDIEN